MNRHADFARLETEWGIIPLAQDYLPQEFRRNYDMAMDAQPTLATTSSAGIPAWLSQFVDPEVVRILQSPNEGANILGERKTGDWTTQTAFFPVVENTGEVSSYGDWEHQRRLQRQRDLAPAPVVPVPDDRRVRRSADRPGRPREAELGLRAPDLGRLHAR